MVVEVPIQEIYELLRRGPELIERAVEHFERLKRDKKRGGNFIYLLREPSREKISLSPLQIRPKIQGVQSIGFYPRFLMTGQMFQLSAFCNFESDLPETITSADGNYRLSSGQRDREYHIIGGNSEIVGVIKGTKYAGSGKGSWGVVLGNDIHDEREWFSLPDSVEGFKRQIEPLNFGLQSIINS